MTKNFIYTASALLLGSAITLTSCQSEEDFGQVGGNGEVLLTVTANRAETGSRTSFEHDGNGGLLTNWDDNDQLVVTDEAGKYLGVLSITSGAGTSSATFEGTVDLGELEAVNIHYLGNALTTGLDKVENEVTFDMSAQNGSFASLTDYDYLYSQTVVTNLNNGTATATIDMARAFATGYFTLDCADFSLEAGDVVTISPAEGTTLYSKPVMKLRNFSWTRNAAAEGTVTITKAEAGNDFYVIFPAAQDITPVFTVTKGTTVYTASLGSHTWNAQTNVNADGTSNTPVKVSGWTKDVQPVNPGDTGNWATPDDVVDPSYTDNGVTFVNDNGMGWCLNWRSVYEYGGWGTYITYDSNGIVNGHMTSKGGTSVYFQWGRWMGLPATCGNLIINSGGSYSGGYKANSQLPLGVNYYNTKIGYCFANSLSGAHGKVYMGSSDWTRERAKNSSIMFGMVNSMISHGDYIGANEDCNWEDRCGNPAPKGYRIPTASELEVLIPSKGTVNGTYAEVKTVNGAKYAFKWTVNTSGSNPVLEIRSFKTTASTVSVNDANFDGVTPIRLMSLGYLDNLGEQQGYGEVAVYWSSESGKLDDGANGGKYLEVGFSGSTATLKMGVLWRSFGGFVLLVKDEEATPDPLTPLFPLTGL